MEGSRFDRARVERPRRDLRTASDEDLLEACRGAVSRVLSELPAHDRQVVEGHRAELVAATHREIRAAIDDIVGAMRQVA